MASLQWWSFLNMSSVLVGLSVFLVLFWLFRRPRNLPPGPRGWPFLGYLPQLAMSSHEPHEVFSKLSARYGNVVCFNMAGVLVVVLHGTSVIREAFAQVPLSSRPRMHVSSQIRSGQGIFSSSGNDSTEIRRFSLKVFRGLGIGKSSFEERIATEANYLIDEVARTKGATFDPKHLLSYAVSNVICSVVFGKRFQYTDDKLRELLRYVYDAFEDIGPGGAIEFVPYVSKLKFLPFVRDYIENGKRVVGLIHTMVKDHNEDYDANCLRDFIDEYLSAIDSREQRGGTFTTALGMDSLEQIVGDLFVAGIETTTTSLRWTLLYLTANPDVQVRIQQELDGVTSRNRFPRLSDKPNLPYTEAALYEIQRISTITPLAVPHACCEDTTLQGYNIPKGTYVLANLWHNHFDPSVWKEPFKFRPERFLSEDGSLMCPEEFTPFGIGRRICLGENLARMELFVFLTLLLHQFTFKNPEGAPPASFKARNGITSAPPNFEVRAIPR